MSTLQIKESPKEYDVVIVGSGAGGGMAGYILATAGVKVLMLEAGPFFDPAKDSAQFKWPWESPRRGASSPERSNGDFDAAFGGWQIDGEPYSADDGTEFHWFRSHMLGGRTNHWGRISLRMGPRDFKGGSYDGATDDWPVSYEEIAPYYDKVDRLIGLYGTKENLPEEPDGIFMPPPKPRLNDLFMIKGARKAGVKIIPGRCAILTQLIPGNTRRSACIYCHQCNRSCKIGADFSSSNALVIPAMDSGNLDVIPNAVVRAVTTGKDGLATGVSYIDKGDMTEYQVKGKAVILAASSCSSARILLNSRTNSHPDGVGNSSGLVGHYLHDSTGGDMEGFLPQLMDRKRYNEDGARGVTILSPWWLDNKNLDFPRGYHIEYSGGMFVPLFGFGSEVPLRNGMVPGKDGKRKPRGGYGVDLKNDYRRFFGTGVHLAGRGLGIARKDNYCYLDPDKVDKYGIPVLKFHYKWSDAEIKQAKHMQDTFAEIFHGMGAVKTSPDYTREQNYGLQPPGKVIHEAGTARMGDDPRTSVVDKWGRVHDCKNLFVTDGSVFTQQGDKNITWTILALSMRTAEYILDQKQKFNM